MQTPTVVGGMAVSKVRRAVAVRPSGERPSVPYAAEAVWANWPVALAKSRTGRGFTTLTGQAASTSARPSGSESRSIGAGCVPNGRGWMRTWMIQHSPVGREREDLLQRVPGLGPVLRHAVVAERPELGRVTRKQIAAWVGVAPFTRDSGRLGGPRTSWGGRPSARLCLWRPGGDAREAPVIRPFYPRLRAAGTAPTVALVAARRTRLPILHAMVPARSHGDRSWHQPRDVKTVARPFTCCGLVEHPAGRS